MYPRSKDEKALVSLSELITFLLIISSAWRGTERYVCLQSQANQLRSHIYIPIG